MPKIKYLTEDTSGKKLRRNVPASLRELAGKSAWVERVSGTTTDIREGANLFAVETDGEIKRLRNLLANSQDKEAASSTEQSGFRIRLSKVDAKRLAVNYFYGIEEDRALSRFYSVAKGWSDLDKASAIADAAADYGDALRATDGLSNTDEPDPDHEAVQISIDLLIEAQFVTEGVFEQREVGRRRKKTVWVAPPELMDNENFCLLIGHVQDAQVELSNRWLEFLQTGAKPENLASGFPGASVSPVSGTVQQFHTVGDLTEAFEAAKTKEGVSYSRQSQFKIVTRSLREKLGKDFRLEDVTRQHCEELAEFYPRIPSHATQHYPKMTLEQAAEAHEKKTGAPARRYDAGKKNLAILKSIFQHAVYLDWREDDPTQKVRLVLSARERRRLEQDNGYDPFTLKELKTIFSAPLYTGCQDDEHGYDKPGANIVKRHRYWVPLIGLFSGMRANEILQLEKSDVSTQDGVAYFDVTEDPSQEVLDVEKRLKTANARRKVPVHPELIRLGFVDWVQNQRKGRLFPEARAGKNKKLSDRYSKWFSNFLKKRGVWVERKKVFHSFRGTFADCLKNAGVPLDRREAIMGWDPKGKMDARYGDGFDVEVLFEEMQKTSYPELDFSALYPA